MGFRILNFSEVHRDAIRAKYPYSETLNQMCNPCDSFVIMSLYFVQVAVNKYRLN